MSVAAKKRRSSSFERTRSPLQSKSQRVEKASTSVPIGSQAIAVFLGLTSLFAFVSLLSQRPEVRALFGAGDARTLMGPLGKVLGTLLFGFFGWCALVPIVWLAWIALMIWRGKFAPVNRPTLLISAGIVGILLCSAVLGALAFGTPGGGSVGVFLAVPLQKLVNTAGATLITGAIFFLSLSTAVEISPRGLVLRAKRLVIASCSFMFLTLPIFAYQSTCAFFGYLLRLADSLSGLDWDREDEEIERRPLEKKEPRPLPKPKVRKNTVEIEQSEPLGMTEAEAAEIVVRRRSFKNPPKGSAAALKKAEDKEEEPIGEGYFIGEYKRPPVDLLTAGTPVSSEEDDEDLKEKSQQIVRKLRDFGILGRITEVHPGPVITLFEFEPAAGVKVGRIASLSDDLAMTLRAVSVRIIAPIPGKGTVGIEVPNQKREWVRLRDLLESRESIEADSSLSVSLGKDTYGDVVVADIARMPHLLIAGATGTGKSVCINTVLISLLYRATPAELGLILIDPKILELSVYDGIPHLRVPVVTNVKQAKGVLEWAINEMNRRYRVMQKLGVRSIDGYNQVVTGEGSGNGVDEAPPTPITPAQEMIDDAAKEEDGVEQKIAPLVTEQLKPLPKIVIVIDELADLMLSVGREIEDLITRLAQKARAAGIHLIVATQRPSVDVITGLIKANFPARLSFQVSSRVDSRTIIDSMGAEKLLGRGDMLFMPPGVGSLMRVHGAFVSDSEVKKVVAALKEGCKPKYDERIIELCEKAMHEDGEKGEGGVSADEYDALYDQALQIVLEKGQASTSMIQRALRIGYNRAARIVEIMERDGIVGPADGVKPRQVIFGRGEEEVA